MENALLRRYFNSRYFGMTRGKVRCRGECLDAASEESWRRSAAVLQQTPNCNMQNAVTKSNYVGENSNRHTDRKFVEKPEITRD